MGSFNEAVNFRYEDRSAGGDTKSDGLVALNWSTCSDEGSIVISDNFFGIQGIRVQKGHIDALEKVIKELKNFGSY